MISYFSFKLGKLVYWVYFVQVYPITNIIIRRGDLKIILSVTTFCNPRDVWNPQVGRTQAYRKAIYSMERVAANRYLRGFFNTQIEISDLEEAYRLFRFNAKEIDLPGSYKAPFNLRQFVYEEEMNISPEVPF